MYENMAVPETLRDHLGDFRSSEILERRKDCWNSQSYLCVFDNKMSNTSRLKYIAQDTKTNIMKAEEMIQSEACADNDET